jgi:hypothetical protein
MRVLQSTATGGNTLCLTRNEQACGSSPLVGSPQIAHLRLKLETGKDLVSAGAGSPDTTRFGHATKGLADVAVGALALDVATGLETYSPKSLARNSSRRLV